MVSLSAETAGGLAGERARTLPPGAPGWLRLTPLCLPILVAAFWFAVLAPADSRLFIGLFDFRAYYTAGRILIEGPRAELYDLSVQAARQAVTWPEMVDPDAQLLSYLYPPFAALPAAAVAWLPVPAAYSVWLAANGVVLAALLHRITSAVEPAGQRARQVALALGLTAVPILMAIVQGQISLLLALAVLEARAAWCDGRRVRAGLWLSLLCMKPHLLALPVLAFAWRRDSRTLTGLGAGAAVWGVISAFLVGPTGLLGYVTFLSAASNWYDEHGIRPGAMHSFRNFLQGELLDRPDIVQPVWLLGVGAVVALLLWSWRTSVAGGAAADLDWAALVVAMVLASPHLYLHDLTLWVAPLALLVRAGAESPATVGRWTGALLALSLYTVLVGATAGLFGRPVYATLPLALAAFAAILWRRERLRRRVAEVV